MLTAFTLPGSSLDSACFLMKADCLKSLKLLTNAYMEPRSSFINTYYGLLSDKECGIFSWALSRTPVRTPILKQIIKLTGCYQGQKTFCGSWWRWQSERKAWPIFRLNHCYQYFKPASSAGLQNCQWSSCLSICFNNNNKTKAFHTYGCKGQCILQHCTAIQLQQWIQINMLFI